MPPVIPAKAIHEQWLGLVQPEYRETLQALVRDLNTQGEWGRDFDKPWNPTGHGWDATTPQQRLERLVFLLYAEGEALIPADSLHGQDYSVSALAHRRGAKNHQLSQ